MNIHPTTGETITGWDEYAIRFKDVMTTPLNHRIKRPDYGCKLYRLQGKPISSAYISRAAAYISESYDNPINKLGDATLMRVKVGAHITGFSILVIINFNGTQQELTL